MRAKRFLFTIFAFTTLFSTATAFAQVRIVALGDSSFVGGGVPANQAYPAQLEAALRAKGHRVTVTNQGVNADSATGVLQRLDFAVPPGTNIVVLKIGEHELKFLHAPRDVIEANRRTIVERLRAKGVEVYLFGLNQMNRGITTRADLSHEGYCSPSIACHANPAGVAVIVHRSLPAIEALVRKVEKRG
jgi:acyl-CoA thioesterase I